MEKMDMDHDGNVGGDEFLATLIDWGQVHTRNWGRRSGVCVHGHTRARAAAGTWCV